MTTPFAWLATRVTLSPKTLRVASTAALIASVLIIIGGAVVRVTGSGLGCPDWPTCTGGSIAPTSEMGIHGVIEFTNRLITVGLCVVVGWVIIAARLQRHPDRDVLRWAWAQFWIVVLNAVVGGVTVWAKLSPYVVAAHFLAATLLLTAATVTREKVRRRISTPESPTTPRVRSLARLLVAATAVLLVIGTVATGTGPHAGDSADVHRMPFSWADVTVIHGLLAMVVLIVAVLLWRTAPDARLRARVRMFVVVLLAQGLIGIIQVVTHLPELVVVLHLLGAALVWVGVIRVLMDAHLSETRTSEISGREEPTRRRQNAADQRGLGDLAPRKSPARLQ